MQIQRKKEASDGARCTQDGKVTEEVAGVQLPRITRLVQQLSNSMGVTQRCSSSLEN
jgi:hypothetical protein